MIETYQEELEKIISSLEQELDDLLKERKKKLFTFKLDKQVLRIRNLLNKFKAESKTLTNKTKTKKAINFIKSLIRKILELNLITIRSLIERKKAKQKSKEKESDAETQDKDNDKLIKKSNQQNLTEEESLLTNVNQEEISSLLSLLDVHSISLLELETEASLKENQLYKSNSYNASQLDLLRNNLLNRQEKINIQHQDKLPNFTPLLINHLLKLEKLLQVIEKYLLSLAEINNAETFVGKYQIEMKKHDKVSEIERLVRVKKKLDADPSYVKKLKSSKSSGHLQHSKLS
jgi:hypothetical protein